MNRFNLRAFTLIEMLVVVIILGIILAIAIPSVSNIINQNRNKMYQAHISIVEEKTKLFIDKYKGELLSKDSNCFQVNYQEFLNHNFITEQDVYCNGIIILTKSGNGKNFTADYYLNCSDKNNDSLHESDAIPTGCMVFSID